MLIAGRDKVSYTFNLAQRRLITIKQNSHFSKDDLENLCRLHGVADRLTCHRCCKNVVAAEDAKRILRYLARSAKRAFGHSIQLVT